MSSLASSRALAFTRAASPRTARGPARRAGSVVAVRAERSSRDAVPAQLHDARSRCAAFAAAVLVAASPAPALAGAPKPPAAYVAELVPTPGHAQVSGSIRFEAALNKSGQEVVFVSPSVRGLSPGAHGLNVHDVDEASGAVGASFNPDGRPHGSPSSIKKFGASACHFVGEGCQWNRHAGDLGNLVADADGNVAGDEKKFKDLYVSLNPKKSGVRRRESRRRARARGRLQDGGGRRGRRRDRRRGSAESRVKAVEGARSFRSVTFPTSLLP
jgi:Cu-Zn family superoxide dismutase